MSGYVPSNFDTNNPNDATIAETAQAEFRNIKGFFQGTLGRMLVPSLISNNGGQNNILTVNIPGGSLKTNKKFRSTLLGFVGNSTGGTQVFGITHQFGGVNFFADTVAISNGSNLTFKFIFELANAGAANQQIAVTELHIFGGALNTGASGSEAANFPAGGLNTNGTIDTTVDQPYSIFFALGVASPNLIANIYSGIVEWM